MADALTTVISAYSQIRDQITTRLAEFRRLWAEGSEEDLFAELVFCLLTPQSRARVCWAAVERLRKANLLLRGSAKDVEEMLKGVRFKRTKAEYIVAARGVFLEGGTLDVRGRVRRFSSPSEAREYLVRTVKGMGYKEASHFLRNVGLGEDLAILDRHILKNLRALGVIEEVPASLTRRIYLEIEEKMREFSSAIGIPMAHLDLLLWYVETGEVFK